MGELQRVAAGEGVEQIVAEIASVHVGAGESGVEIECSRIEMALDGVVGDHHRSFERTTFAGDKQPKGTVRRNERHWSAVSIEELREISDAMDLVEELSPATLSANLCLRGVAELSRLPKGTTLTFPSGVVLTVVEYNPPCRKMGELIATRHTTRSGAEIAATMFPKAAKLKRGIVGVVDVPGEIAAGDEVVIDVYETPAWLVRTPGV